MVQIIGVSFLLLGLFALIQEGKEFGILSNGNYWKRIGDD